MIFLLFFVIFKNSPEVTLNFIFAEMACIGSQIFWFLYLISITSYDNTQLKKFKNIMMSKVFFLSYRIKKLANVIGEQWSEKGKRERRCHQRLQVQLRRFDQWREPDDPRELY